MVRSATVGAFGVVLALASPGTAAVDVNGEWVVSASGVGGDTFFRLVQGETSLSIAGRSTSSSQGTIDAATGQFTVSRTFVYFFFYFCNETIEGMFAPDGLSFTGTYTGECPSANLFVAPRPVTGARCDQPGVACCGNAVVEADEVCEGFCCEACGLFSARGTECTNDRNVCTDDVCDGAGSCVHEPNTLPCTPTGPCDPLGTCADGACIPGPCRQSDGSGVVSFSSDPFRPLRWRWRDSTGATTLADFGDVTGSMEYRFCWVVPHVTGPALRASNMPASFWRADGRGFTLTGPPGWDISSVRIRANSRGAQITADAGPPSIQWPVTGPVNVRLVSKDLAGACFETTFRNPVVSNDRSYRALE